MMGVRFSFAVFLLAEFCCLLVCKGFLSPHKYSLGLLASRSTTVKSLGKISVLKDPVEPVTPVQESENAKEDTPLFDFAKAWYPLAVEDFTSKDKPHALQFLGNDVVLWYSKEDSSWRVFEDSCPHRGVPLSEGRIEENGELLCAYHAWTFGPTGECTGMPHLGGSEAKQKQLRGRACVKQHPVRVAQGLVWAWGEGGGPGADCHLEAALKPPRLIEELQEGEGGRPPEGSGHSYNFRDLPYGWDMFMENVLDPAHVSVSHHNIVGNRYKDPQPFDLERMEPLELEGYPEDTGFKHRINFQSPSDTGVVSTNEFRPPCLTKITTEYPSGAKSILALYATPTRPGYCRHIGCQVFVGGRNGEEAPGLGAFKMLPTWATHLAASLFLHQDQVFLHHQERKLYASSNYAFGDFSADPQLAARLTTDPEAYASTYFTPSPADKQITDLRRWIHGRAGGGVRWGAAALAGGLPPRLRPADLFDVWHSHTENCEVCLSTLGRVRAGRRAAAVGAAAALVGAAAALGRGARGAGVAGAAAATVLALAAKGLRKAERLFHVYEFSHQNND